MIKVKMFTLAACVFCFTMSLGLLTDNRKPKPHTCEYITCPYLGQTIYKHQHTGASGEPVNDEGSDCDALDFIHFNHPALTYDECENLLFTNNLYYENLKLAL